MVKKQKIQYELKKLLVYSCFKNSSNKFILITAFKKFKNLAKQNGDPGLLLKIAKVSQK